MYPEFDASSWGVGPGGLGYGDDDEQTTVPAGTISVFARAVFTVTEEDDITDALLHMDFDDGFVAYMNSVEIARAGLAGQPPGWSEMATEHEAQLYQGGAPQAFPLDRAAIGDLLVEGPNVLAVQVHNVASDSSDLTLRPFLHFGLAAGAFQFGPNPPWFVPPGSGGAGGGLHANFRLKGGETLTLTSPAGGRSDSVEIRSDLRRGHAMARVGESWCVSDIPTPGEDNGAECFSDYSASPSFSLPAGFYDDAQSVSIAGTNVRFTTGGRMPDAAAERYTAEIGMTRNTVIRAIAYEAGKLPSDIATAAYFIGEHTTLPVVSVVTSPGDLFSGGEGGGPAIYDNFESGLKVPCEVAYFDETRSQRFTERCAMRVVGNFSKAFAQKSMQFTFEGDFGARGDVPNALFSEDKPQLGSLHGFRVRNMDDDATSARMRDAIANRMAIGTDAASTASQNVAVFVNGAYWGHYVARELLNEYFVRDNFGADPDAVDIVKTHVGETFADAGSREDFDDLVAYVTTADLSLDANMDDVRRRADLDNWTDYWITQIYIANGDWYSSSWLNNIQAFRGRPPADDRWRFVLWDCAYAMALSGGVTSADFDSLDFALANPASQNFYTPMFQNLLRNDGFRTDFINRFADLMNGAWTPELMHRMVDDSASSMAGEIGPNYDRWSQECNGAYCPPSTDSWRWSVDELKRFFSERPEHQRAHLGAFFGLSRPVDVRVDVRPAGAGHVRISTLTPSAYPWQGVYFAGNHVTVTALPAEGWVFTGWDVADADPARRITVDPELAPETLVAHFARVRRGE
jgi:hypothetical protein